MYICRIKLLINQTKRIMKKLLVIVAAILSFSVANAQVAYLGYQSVSGTAKTEAGNTTTKTTSSCSGFFAGGAMNFDIASGIGVQPGLELNFFSDKEGKNKLTSFGVKIPIDVNYGFEINPDIKISAFAGPSIYLGLSRKTKGEYYDPIQDKDVTTTVNFYDDDNDFSRFGLGFGLGAWCDFKDMIRLKIGYEIGLNDRETAADNYTYKENVFSISVGYIF